MSAELNGIFGRVPKESFELLQRNLELRKRLEKVYRDYRNGFPMQIEDFNAIFNEIFRFFFRPLEITILLSKPLLLFLPTSRNLSLFEVSGETLQAYEEFLKSLKDHFELTAKLIENKFTGEFLEEFRSYIRHFKPESDFSVLDYKIVADYPYILTNRALRHVSKSIEAWDGFSRDYAVFKELMLAAYRNAVEEFVEVAEKSKLKSYAEFSEKFYAICAKHFDALLSSEEYLRIRGRMNANLMDHIYHFRRFYEEILENSPISPFATISQIDEAYRRITDLKRRISELERRLRGHD